MYKKDIYLFGEIYKQALLQGKKATLLYQEGDHLYRAVHEFIFILKKIKEVDPQYGFTRIDVQLGDGKIYSTSTYLEKDVKENDILSGIGFFSTALGNELCLSLKGGTNKYHSKPRDINFLIYDRVYKMGSFIELSEPIASPVQRHYLWDEDKPIQLIDRFYYYIEDIIKQEAKSSKGIKTQENGGIDFSKIVVDEDTEDIGEIPEPFEVEEHTKDIEEIHETSDEHKSSNEHKTPAQRVIDNIKNGKILSI